MSNRGDLPLFCDSLQTFTAALHFSTYFREILHVKCDDKWTVFSLDNTLEFAEENAGQTPAWPLLQERLSDVRLARRQPATAWGSCLFAAHHWGWNTNKCKMFCAPFLLFPGKGELVPGGRSVLRFHATRKLEVPYASVLRGVRLSVGFAERHNSRCSAVVRSVADVGATVLTLEW